MHIGLVQGGHHHHLNNMFLPQYTVDSRYLEVDGTTEIIRLTRSSTQRN